MSCREAVRFAVSPMQSKSAIPRTGHLPRARKARFFSSGLRVVMRAVMRLVVPVSGPVFVPFGFDRGAHITRVHLAVNTEAQYPERHE
jgi:hypothetical protein